MSIEVLDRRPTAYIDCDEVVLEFITRYVDMVNLKHGTMYTINDSTCYDLTKTFPEEKYPLQIMKRPSFYRDMMPMCGINSGLALLKAKGYRIALVTACSPQTIQFKIERLQKLGLLSLFDTKIFIFGDLINKMDVKMTSDDVFIDDKYENISCSNAGLKILFPRPHNREICKSLSENEFEGIYVADMGWRSVKGIVSIHGLGGEGY